MSLAADEGQHGQGGHVLQVSGSVICSSDLVIDTHLNKLRKVANAGDGHIYLTCWSQRERERERERERKWMCVQMHVCETHAHYMCSRLSVFFPCNNATFTYCLGIPNSC